MNWTRCSRPALALVVALAVVAAAATPAAAVSVSADAVPDRAEVDERVTATFTVTELYTDYDNWTLVGGTDLRNATWTVTLLDNRGRQIGDKRTYTSRNFSQGIGGETDEVTVRLEGDVPEIANFSYEPAQSFTVARLVQSQQGGTSTELDAWSASHFTGDSSAAREAIGEAAAAIDDAEEAGADVSEAETLLDSAVSAYDNANFENAENLAGQAGEAASGAASSRQQTRLLLLGGVAVVVLAVLAGVGYWLLQRRRANRYDKL